jgi:hypothetical protein
MRVTMSSRRSIGTDELRVATVRFGPRRDSLSSQLSPSPYTGLAPSLKRHSVGWPGIHTRHCHVHSSENRCNSAHLSEPIAHDETLESKLVFQDVILEPRILTRRGIIDLVVRAHHCTDSSFDRVLKRPHVDLMKCAIINVCGNCIMALPEMLLLIPDVMLCGSNDTRLC